MGTTNMNVQISSRIRISMWANPDHMVGGLSGGKVVFKPSIVKALESTTGLDDVSFVQTIQPIEGGKVAFAHSWLGGAPKLRESYCHDVVELLHSMKLQVLCGYEVVDRGKSVSDLSKFFNSWLASASPGDIKGHAQEIANFVNGYGFDGIGFDLETNGLGFRPQHEPNLRLLFQELATILSKDNKIVTYANAGPVSPHGDGETDMKFMKIQPFALAKVAPNIIARPMCYDGSGPANHTGWLKHIINTALGTGPGQAGLHPSQLQLGIKVYHFEYGYVSADTLESHCKDFLRANRVGIVCYILHVDHPGRISNCARYDTALNPGEAPRGTPGQPLQCPIGASNWKPTAGPAPGPGTVTTTTPPPPPDADLRIAPKVLRTVNTLPQPACSVSPEDVAGIVAHIAKRAQEPPTDVFGAPDYNIMPPTPEEQWARSVAEHLTPLPYTMPDFYYDSGWARHMRETSEYPLVAQCQQSVSIALMLMGVDFGGSDGLDCSIGTRALFKSKGDFWGFPGGTFKPVSDAEWARLKPGSVFLWGQPASASDNRGHVAVVLRKHPTERKFQVWDTGAMCVRTTHQDDQPAAAGKGSYEESWHATVPSGLNAPILGIGYLQGSGLVASPRARGIARLILRERGSKKLVYRSSWINMGEKGLSKAKLLRSLRGAPGSEKCEARWLLNAWKEKNPKLSKDVYYALLDFYTTPSGEVRYYCSGRQPNGFLKRDEVPVSDWKDDAPFAQGASVPDPII